MIRLRKADGGIVAVPEDTAAVEICSSDGKLARVFLTGKDGRITILEPKDRDFKLYANVVRAETADLISYKS